MEECQYQNRLDKKTTKDDRSKLRTERYII